MFSEGGFVLKALSQVRIAGGNYLKKYENYNELPLTLSVPEVAAVLGISRAGAYELVHSASFPKVKIGKRILVPKDKLIEWLDAQVEVAD
jgi:excisionase family DNA binding protein